MIRKLKWKFTAILMAITAILMAVILVTLYYSIQARFYQWSMGAIHEAMIADYDRQMPPDSPPFRDMMPLLVVQKRTDGTIEILKNQLLNVTDSQAAALVDLTGDRAGRTGTLPEKHLRYAYEIGPEGTRRYVFVDIYQEQNSLSWQIIYSAIIGLCAMAAFFVAAMFLSRWAVRPVEEAWDRQRQFVADASHELKTPLAVISANIGLLSSSPKMRDEKTSQRLGHIQAESTRMKQLVEGLLCLAKSDAGTAVPVRNPVDFSYLVSSRAAMFEPLAFDAGKCLTSRLDEGIFVNGNETELCRLVDILLDNACKYGDPGGPIQVSLTRGSREASLCVSNQGPPLSREELDHIFLRFYRADAARTSNESGGYGLGLPIAKAIACGHGGKIEASTDGHHTNRFTVRLPLGKSL